MPSINYLILRRRGAPSRRAQDVRAVRRSPILTRSRESGVSADREGALGSLYPFLCGTRKDEAGQAGAAEPLDELRPDNHL